MRRQFLITIPSLILLTSLNACASDKKTVEQYIEEHKTILLGKFPGAQFTEADKGRFKGQEVFEYEFRFQNKSYEAFLTEDGKILRLGLD